MGPSNNNQASLLRDKMEETSTGLYFQWHFLSNTERLNYCENQLSKILKVHTGAIGVGIVTVESSPRAGGKVEM